MTAYISSYEPDFFSKMILVVNLIISQSFVEFEQFSVSRWLAYVYLIDVKTGQYPILPQKFAVIKEI